jgi:hypothetical protein
MRQWPATTAGALGPLPVEAPLVMDRAYESDETRTVGAGVEYDSGGST